METSKARRVTVFFSLLWAICLLLSRVFRSLTRLLPFAHAWVTIMLGEHGVRSRFAVRVRYRRPRYGRLTSRYRQLRPRQSLRRLVRFTGYPVVYYSYQFLLSFCFFHRCACFDLAPLFSPFQETVYPFLDYTTVLSTVPPSIDAQRTGSSCILL